MAILDEDEELEEFVEKETKGSSDDEVIDFSDLEADDELDFTCDK